MTGSHIVLCRDDLCLQCIYRSITKYIEGNMEKNIKSGQLAELIQKVI